MFLWVADLQGRGGDVSDDEHTGGRVRRTWRGDGNEDCLAGAACRAFETGTT